jgi:glycosyltransferase involved in cell wall biosynthesis
MNILVITTKYLAPNEMYYHQDTAAVHYLVKNLIGKDNVYVIFIYQNSIRHLFSFLRFFNKNRYKSGYPYKIDNVNVILYEEQLLPKQKCISKQRAKEIASSVKLTLQTQGFSPDVCMVHFPTVNYRLTDILCKYVKCIFFGVLHISDYYNVRSTTNYLKYFHTLKKVFCRSTYLYHSITKNYIIPNISEEVVFSGAPLLVDDGKTVQKFIPHNPIRILFVGKLIPRKNIKIVLSSYMVLKGNFRLLIIGDGPERGIVEDHVRKNSTIEYIPRTTRENVQKKMQESDIFILPSINETFGLVYLEAMRMGCLCIGTKGEGIDGIIKNRVNGFLLDEVSPSNISLCMKEILSLSNNKREEIVKNAISTAKLFSEENASAHYRQLILNSLSDVVNKGV